MTKTLLIALLVGVCTWLGAAQTKVVTLSGFIVTGINPKTGNMVGRGDPLGGVEIEVQGTEYRALSSTHGYFAIEDLPDGEYTLVCRKPGFPTVQQRVRVAYLGTATRCQILMNPANSGFVGDMAVKSGDVYVAFSEKLDNENGIDSSPYKLVHQQKVAAGANILPGQPTLPKMPWGPGEAHLMNPIVGFNNCLMVYRPESPARSGFVEMATRPYWLCFNRSGSILYVAGASHCIMVLDAMRNNAPLRNLPTQGPVCDLSLSGDGRYLLACLMGANPGVLLIDTQTNLPAGFLPTPSVPWSAVMAGPRVFACCGDARSGQVVALDAATGTTIGSCKVGNRPTSIRATPDFSRVYVACSGQASVSVVDTVSVTELGRIAVQIEPQKLAISPDGSRCLVTNKHSSTVSVIDLQAGAVLDHVEVGKTPIGVVFDRHGRKAYVACKDDRCVMTLDGRSGQLLHTTLPLPNAVPFGLAIRP